MKKLILLAAAVFMFGCGGGGNDQFSTNKTLSGTYTGYAASPDGHYDITFSTPSDGNRPAGRIGYHVANEPIPPYTQPFYLVTTIDNSSGQIVQRYLQSGETAPLMLAD